MIVNRTFTALLAAHMLVASIAWVCGYCAGRLMERRSHEVVDLAAVERDVAEFVRLLAPPAPPYDWEHDGEAEVPRS